MKEKTKLALIGDIDAHRKLYSGAFPTTTTSKKLYDRIATCSKRSDMSIYRFIKEELGYSDYIKEAPLSQQTFGADAKVIVGLLGDTFDWYTLYKFDRKIADRLYRNAKREGLTTEEYAYCFGITLSSQEEGKQQRALIKKREKDQKKKEEDQKKKEDKKRQELETKEKTDQKWKERIATFVRGNSGNINAISKNTTLYPQIARVANRRGMKFGDYVRSLGFEYTPMKPGEWNRLAHPEEYRVKDVHSLYSFLNTKSRKTKKTSLYQRLRRHAEKEGKSIEDYLKEIGFGNDLSVSE
ncbi:MAG: hypothetical protein LBO09_09380 [Candidatus Peribacteria bacterium]|jgi:hypothetical protein|nr:hypothetical protein [Candidatus Peribacteria bacterium]